MPTVNPGLAAVSLDLFRLDGKVALVTGASRGLGAAMAVALARAGADVALHSNERPASETATEASRRYADAGVSRCGGATSSSDSSSARSPSIVTRSSRRSTNRV